MADDIARSFAHHYQIGKFSDLRLVAKDGTTYSVHKLIVCSHSPILDAQAADGADAIDVDADATTVVQMIEWMYGIDDKKLLIEGKSFDKVTAMGSGVVCGEIATLLELAKLAEKYQLPKLKDQATELVGQLAETLTSIQHILEAVIQLAAEGALGSVQKALASRALVLATTQRSDLEQNPDEPMEDAMPTPLASHGNASEDGEHESAININRSALRSARTPMQTAQKEDEDSDTPLSEQRNKRKHQQREHNQPPPPPSIQKQQEVPSWTDFPPPMAPERRPDIQKQQDVTPAWTDFPPPMAPERRPDLLVNDSPPSPGPRNPFDTSRRGAATTYTGRWKVGPDEPPPIVRTPVQAVGPTAWALRQLRPGPSPVLPHKPTQNKTPQTRRNEPFRISTALPENDPPQGPHCHCKAAESDETLLPCAACGRKFHPRCVGKGRYAKASYGGDPKRYMLQDLQVFVDKPFKCGDCEAGFFGVK